MAISSSSSGASFSTSPSIIDQAGVPSLLALPDGSIRLFWMQPPVGTTGRSVIYSATSAPGSALDARFVVDPGARLDLGTMDYDPTVAFCGGEWLMWVSAAESTVFATSPDGLAFTQQATPSGLGTAFPWSAACLPDGWHLGARLSATDCLTGRRITTAV